MVEEEKVDPKPLVPEENVNALTVATQFLIKQDNLVMKRNVLSAEQK